MREDWTPAAPPLNLSRQELTALIQPTFPDQSVSKWETARGGLANNNIRIWIPGQENSFLLRFIIRDSKEARKEYALNRLLLPQAPVPEFLHFYDQNPVTGHPCILMEWVEGERLELAAPHLSADQAAVVGRSVGTTLARIHAIKFPQSGFLNSELEVAVPIEIGRDGLIGFLRKCLIDGLGSQRLGAELTGDLMNFAAKHGALLDTWDGPPCLAHCDFGGSNILVKETSGRWEVAAVLDWEFAFSGSPFFDFGNLLRAPLGDLPGFEQAVERGYCEAGGVLPPEWRRLSRLTDLTAWADFLNRENASPALIRDAREMIAWTIQ